jgi:hypothetical protein
VVQLRQQSKLDVDYCQCLTRHPRVAAESASIGSSRAAGISSIGRLLKARIRESWERTCAAEDIAGVHFHDLRREFACSETDAHKVRIQPAVQHNGRSEGSAVTH